MAIGSTPAEIDRRAEIVGSPMLRDAAVIGPPAQLADCIAELAKARADTVYLHIFDIHDLDHIALIGAEVLPQLAGL